MPPECRQEIHDAERRILDACACAYARWFLAMRRCIGQERVRQQLFREDNGLPKSAKVAYSRPAISASDKAVAESSEAIIRSMFGDTPADYAKAMFCRAIDTGDMRSFKIRLLVIKTRDSLKGSPMYRQFSNGMEYCISSAESMAGCVPDPSPRRLSRSEQERKRILQLNATSNTLTQQELELEWPTEKCRITERAIARQGARKTAGVEPYGQEGRIGGTGITSGTGKKNNENISSLELENSKLNINNSVTVTHHIDSEVNTSEDSKKICRYDSVDDIIGKIESGDIEPYMSATEICEDLKRGKISPVEALMLTAAMDRYLPSDDAVDREEEDYAADKMPDYGEEGLEPEAECGDAECGFSYNPRGFAGSAEGYSEWEQEEDW